MHTKIWSENLKRKDHSEDLGAGCEDNMRKDLKETRSEVRVWNGFI